MPLAFLKRLMGIMPHRHVEPSKPWPRVPTDAEQGFIDALDGLSEQLKEFTRRIEERAKKNEPRDLRLELAEKLALLKAQEAAQHAPPAVVKAPPWLVQRMAELKARTPPFGEEVETQMKFSAATSKCLDQGMSPEQVKDYVLLCAEDIIAARYPWRKKIAPGHYQSGCGCITDVDGKLVPGGWCGDHY
jgi:hypothetical protein